MTAVYDPIVELRKHGYTEREASFLYLVGVHSGYFLRRQFLTFIKREDGAMVQRFLEKSVEREHVHPIEYAAGRHIYHLRSKLIYRVLGQEDSQNRRTKGDRQIKARLMQVDYLLDHFGERFLETAQQKLAFFHEKLGIAPDALPQTRYGRNETSVYFPDRFPVAVKQEPSHAAATVTLVFIDDGMRSISAFVGWLEKHASFLGVLHRAEVIYAADNSRNFDAADREFLRWFPPSTATKELPRGLEHFLSYLKIRTRYDKGTGMFPIEDARVLDEGNKLYTSLAQQGWLSSWKNGLVSQEKIRAFYEPQMKQIAFRGYLLGYDYPIWSMKYRRAVL
jgi:hypothetical protein